MDQEGLRRVRSKGRSKRDLLLRELKSLWLISVSLETQIIIIIDESEETLVKDL